MLLEVKPKVYFSASHDIFLAIEFPDDFVESFHVFGGNLSYEFGFD